MRSDDLRSLRLILYEIIHFRDGPVEHSHFVAVVVHVQNEVLSHHRQTNQSNVTTSLFHQSSPDRRPAWDVPIFVNPPSSIPLIELICSAADPAAIIFGMEIVARAIWQRSMDRN
jgi:hypothetical protein